MLEEFKKKGITDTIDELKKDEARKFAIAYESVGDDLRGYIQELPQNTKVYYESVDADTLKELKKIYGYNRVYVSKSGNGTYYAGRLPYLGIDGYLQLCAEFDYSSINIEFKDLKDKTVILAHVTLKKDNVERCATGVVEMAETDEGTGQPDDQHDIEKLVSMAVRKALALAVPTGRFPIHKTEYGDHPMVTKFREFCKNEKKG